MHQLELSLYALRDKYVIMKFHNRAKYHINGRLPGFEYPYWELPEKTPEEAEEEAVMLIGGLLYVGLCFLIQGDTSAW